MPIFVTIIGWVIVVIASVAGSGIMINHLNNKAMNEFKLAITNQVTAISTTVSENKGQVCNFHQESFNRVHQKIDDTENRFADQMEKFTETVNKLNETVAVLANEVKHISGKK